MVNIIGMSINFIFLVGEDGLQLNPYSIDMFNMFSGDIIAEPDRLNAILDLIICTVASSNSILFNVLNPNNMVFN